MRYSIGEQLGVLAAQFERDLSEDPDDIEAMQKLALVSESFRNFSMGNLEGFKGDFDRGYEKIVASDKEMQQLNQARFEGEQADRGHGDIPNLNDGP